MNSTVQYYFEWVRCILSPRYAQTTWLRIDPEKEERVLDGLKKACIGISVAAVLMGFLFFYRFGQYMEAKAEAKHNTIHIEIQYKDDPQVHTT